MLRVGLTGGIGAGKSTVTYVLEAAGAVIVDADKIAREVVEPGSPGLDLLTAEFGEEIIREDGTLDREALAKLAFASSERTAALNAITHPLIGERTAELFAEAPDDAIVVHDMPLIVEGGMAPSYQLVLVVDTPAEERLRRLVEARGMDEADARARMQRQASDEQRQAVADVLIDNSGPQEDTEEAVRSLYLERLIEFERNLRAGRAVTGSDAVVHHRPEWSEEAARAIARLEFVLGELAVRIEHLGPTAEPGRDAADIVELQVVVAEEPDIALAVAALTGAGYVRESDHGRPLLRWCDPARPLEITVVSDIVEPVELTMSEAIEEGSYASVDDGANGETTPARGPRIAAKP